MIFGAACHQWDNFTTYFNTYYNADRLMDESEDEFDYQDEKIRVTPTVYVPEPEIKKDDIETGPPPFAREFIISQQQLQPVKVKLDSVLIKGSKILANHPKSDFVEGTLYLMAKTYFYKGEWLPSQIKCSELVDKYPDGEYSPDAHLLLSKNLLIQRKFYAGEIMLSRTVDVAWQLGRYDILSEAFRLEAELALYQDDLDKALRPYKQAVAQGDDGEMRARWQVDLAALLFRMHEFERAEREFSKVHDYSPDYLAYFEAKLYRAASLIRLERFGEAEKILEQLENDGKFEEWTPHIFSQRLQLLRFQEKENDLIEAERFADSAYVNNPAIMTYYYERGMDFYEQDNMLNARNYFSKSRTLRTPVFDASQKMYNLLTIYDQRRKQITTSFTKFKAGEELSDSARVNMAMKLFEIGRVQEQLGKTDSAEYYYEMSAKAAPPEHSDSPRFYYSYARSIRDKDPYKADSLLELIVNYHPMTEYGKESRIELGFTEAFVIDTVGELYRSGKSLLEHGEYDYAEEQLRKIYSKYPEDDLAPRSLYALGWLYENEVHNVDSALYFYKILIRKYPRSEYAKDVKPGVEYLLAVRNGEEPPEDSPSPKNINDKSEQEIRDEVNQREMLKMQQHIQQAPPGNLDINRSKDIQIQDAVKNPGSLLEGAKDAIKNPKNLLEEMKLPSPSSIFGGEKDENKNKEIKENNKSNAPDTSGAK
ncbi:MAG: tetratricopeptide repeat protein [Candidatus Kapaibacterium sp.]